MLFRIMFFFFTLGSAFVRLALWFENDERFLVSPMKNVDRNNDLELWKTSYQIDENSEDSGVQKNQILWH